MFRRAAILLFLLFSALATGIPQALHEKTHELQDAQQAALAPQTPEHSPGHPDQPAHHSDEDCPICAQFHAPLILAASAPLLINSGTCITPPHISPTITHSQPSALRLSCRGPPAPQV